MFCSRCARFPVPGIGSMTGDFFSSQAITTCDGVAPTFANYENGTYRYGKKLYFIMRSGGSEGVRRFVDFVRSADGVKVLREAEVLPEAQ